MRHALQGVGKSKCDGITARQIRCFCDTQNHCIKKRACRQQGASRTTNNDGHSPPRVRSKKTTGLAAAITSSLRQGCSPDTLNYRTLPYAVQMHEDNSACVTVSENFGNPSRPRGSRAVVDVVAMFLSGIGHAEKDVPSFRRCGIDRLKRTESCSQDLAIGFCPTAFQNQKACMD